jgi:hypothetical protein
MVQQEHMAVPVLVFSGTSVLISIVTALTYFLPTVYKGFFSPPSSPAFVVYFLN